MRLASPVLVVTELPVKAVETLESFGSKPELLSAERMAEPRKPLSMWWGVAAAIPLLALNVGIWIGLILAILAGFNWMVAQFH